jgi:hypothetical protein
MSTRLLAMKGRWPPDPDGNDSAEPPRGWRIEAATRLTVPGLDAERHVIRLCRTSLR